MISFSDISKYRQELMGLAILGVLFSHIVSLGQGTGYIVTFPFKVFDNLVFTQGFLLLSGFGLYYSWTKEHSVWHYFKKRIGRLMIPFWIMSVPFYLYVCAILNNDYGKFVENILTAYFWLHGNNGMWYISITVLLYILFPLLYKIIFSKSNPKAVAVRALCVFILMEAINGLIYVCAPSYYDMVSIGITQAPIFVIGMLFGYYSSHKYMFSRRTMMWLILVLVVLVGIKRISPFFQAPMILTLRIVTIILVCYIFNKVMFLKNVMGGVKWCGKYTLELYVLHLHIYGLILQCRPFGTDVVYGMKYSFWEILVAVVLSLLLCVPINRISNILSKRICL